MMLQWKALIFDDTAVRLSQFNKRRSYEQGAQDSNPGPSNTHVWK